MPVVIQDVLLWLSPHTQVLLYPVLFQDVLVFSPSLYSFIYLRYSYQIVRMEQTSHTPAIRTNSPTIAKSCKFCTSKTTRSILCGSS